MQAAPASNLGPILKVHWHPGGAGVERLARLSRGAGCARGGRASGGGSAAGRQPRGAGLGAPHRAAGARLPAAGAAPGHGACVCRRRDLPAGVRCALMWGHALAAASASCPTLPSCSALCDLPVHSCCAAVWLLPAVREVMGHWGLQTGGRAPRDWCSTCRWICACAT